MNKIIKTEKTVDKFCLWQPFQMAEESDGDLIVGTFVVWSVKVNTPVLLCLFACNWKNCTWSSISNDRST